MTAEEKEQSAATLAKLVANGDVDKDEVETLAEELTPKQLEELQAELESDQRLFQEAIDKAGFGDHAFLVQSAEGLRHAPSGEDEDLA